MSRFLLFLGVIDGDGSITKVGVKIVSGSELFLEDMKLLLTKLNVYSGKIIAERSTTFVMYVTRKDDLFKIKSIYAHGSSYPRKKQSINKL